MDESQFFYVCDGQVLKSIGDLKGSLSNDMSDEAFRFHCNTERNDFASWIMDVMGNKKLSKSISKVKTRTGMLKKIKKKK
jgi:hypothetical protein